MKTVIGLDNTYLSYYCDLSFQVFRSISSFIISILNPPVILRVWSALIGTRIVPSIALDRIFFPSQWGSFLEIRQSINCLKKTINLKENEKQLLQLSSNQLKKLLCMSNWIFSFKMKAMNIYAAYGNQIFRN